jgi:uncharacterized protein HemY
LRANEALAVFTERGDVDGQARAENLLGQAAMAEQDFDAARTQFTRALAYFEGANDPAAAAIVRNNLGLVERRDPAGNKTVAHSTSKQPCGFGANRATGAGSPKP